MDPIRQLGLAASFTSLLVAAFLSPAALAAPKTEARPAAAAPEIVPFKEATFLLPEGAKVAARWVVPPSLDSGAISMLSVDAEGNVLFGSSYESRIISPSKQYVVTLKPYELRGMTHLAGGALVLAVGNDIGLPAVMAKPALSDKGIPVVGFQPLVGVPVKRINVFAGAGSSVYCAGEVAGTGRHALFRLRTVEGGGVQGLERLFDTPKPITAVTGDDEATFVALGQVVIRISRKDGSVTPLYTHPSEKITALAITPAGLIASTDSELTLVGPNGSLEIMRSSGHAIHLRGETLYVLFSKSSSVLALDNLADLARFNLAVRPVAPAEAASPLVLSALRFFESGPPPYARRDFAESFDRKTVRRVVGQIDYRAANPPKNAKRHTVTVSWFEPTGGRLTTVNYPLVIGPGAANGQLLASIGQEEGGKGYVPRSRGEGGLIWRFGKDALGARYPGRYRVTVEVDGIPLGEGGFTLTGAAKPYEAMAYNDPAMIRTLLAQGWNPKVKDEDGDWPIHLAGIFGTTEVMEMLLKAGADPNQPDKDGEVPLARSSAQFPDWKAKAELLVRYGANINAAPNGQPLLFSGSYEPEFPAFIIERGANINVRDKHFKLTPGERIFNFCKEPVLSALIKRGVNINTKDPSGRSALGEAIFLHDDACAALLLAKGAALGSEKWPMQTGNRSVLFFALMRWSEAAPDRMAEADRIVRLLLNKGAGLNPGEGWIMFRGGAHQYFDRATLTRTLQEEDDALREAGVSPDPALQEMALANTVARIRQATARANDGVELRTAHRHCEAGFKLAEAKYRTIQADVALTASAGAAKSPAEGRVGMLLSGREGGGAYILKIVPGGAGDRAGLKAGDVVLAADGQKAKGAADIAAAAGRQPASGTLRLELLRDEAMSQPDLLLACGILEKAMREPAMAEMNLGRWLAANPKAEQADGVRALLEGRALADASPSWGASTNRPGGAGCTMQ